MVRSKGARIGELLALRWEHCHGYVTFWETKNGRASVSLSARRSTLY
jgi:hypothetical protein